MKPMIVADLDALARTAIKENSLENLSLDIHLAQKCHPTDGMKTTRAYEGDNLMLTCATCNLFVANIKVATE